MRIGRRRIGAIVFTGAALLATALMIPLQTGAAVGRAINLEGAWIATVQGGPGQWIFTYASDPSGRRASSHGGVLIHPSGTPASALEHHTPVIGELVMIGPDTALFSGIFYSTGGSHEIVDIGTVRGTITFMGPRSAEGTYTFDFYAASADPDGDGIPEGDPYTSFTVETLETRVPFPVQ